jgi:acetyl-CoA synthetase
MNRIIQNGQYNIGHICTRFQCEHGDPNRVAMRWLDADAIHRTDFSFLQLEKESNRFANALIRLGFHEGDILFTFLPKMPEQFISFLGILKIKAIVGPLFSNFGNEALLDRLADAKAIVTKSSLLNKVLKVLPQLPSLKTIIVVDIDSHRPPHILSYPRLLAESSDDFQTPPTSAETPSVLHYTSGSTGKPKGVLHVHGSVVLLNLTASSVLQLNDRELFWCTADQGWVTGTSYGIIGPWSLGATQVHYGGGYDPEAWFSLLEREKVSIWYTAPTALRMLMREKQEYFKKFNLPSLKHIFSVGEPLNPEVLHWARNVLGHDIHDTWFQTETGGIMIANRPGLEIRPGSMGIPVQGITAAIIGDDGTRLPDTRSGNLCLAPGWPSMFVTYLKNEKVYTEKFRHGFYFSGDTAYRDRDGYFWFLGRSDDVINTAGHLVSPFEVESSLLEIAEIAESGVVGVPDDLLYEKVVAFIALKPGCSWSKELDLKIRLHVSNRISSTACPQDVRVLESIPKNKSGKIMRRVLRAKYTGEAPGDVSTLEI